MKNLAILVAACSVVWASDKKALPAQSKNDDIEITSTVLLDPAEVHQELGGDPGPGVVVVRVKAKPKGEDAIRISPDDFTLVSHKNGDRSDALAPAQIVSKSSLTVKRDTSGRDWAQQTNQPGFTGVGSVKKSESGSDDDALLAALKAKQLPDGETKDPVEGLIYFSIDGSKLKPKDLSLIYKGVAGRLVIDYK